MRAAMNKCSGRVSPCGTKWTGGGICSSLDLWRISPNKEADHGNVGSRYPGKQSLLPLLQIVVALWAAEAILTMLLKEHHKSKKKKERDKRRLEYQDRRMANDEEHAKVTRAMRYDVLRRDGFRCVKCGRGREDGVKLHVDHIKPVSRGGKSVMSNLQTLCEDCNCGKGNKYEE